MAVHMNVYITESVREVILLNREYLIRCRIIIKRHIQSMVAINEQRRKFMLLIFSLSSHHRRDPRLTSELPASFENLCKSGWASSSSGHFVNIEEPYNGMCVRTTYENLVQLTSFIMVARSSEPVDKLLSSTVGGRGFGCGVVKASTINHPASWEA